MTRVLIVEDEESFADPLAFLLRREGFTAAIAATGQEALVEFDRNGADIVLLDLMLPGMSGTDVCKQLRARSAVPVIMVTARDSEIDKVVGLELGADDYLSKPVSIRELQARVSAVLRRVEMMRSQSRTLEGDAQPILHEALDVNPVSREVVSAGERVALTAKEFDLLHLLVANPGRVFSREYLLDRLWGTDYDGDDRTVDTHILRVRRKLGGAGTPADRIVTLWGVGYKYEQPRP